MIQILHVYGLPKKIVTAIMMLYRNTKAMVLSLDGYTNFFDIVAGVLLIDTSALYLFKFRTSIDLIKENGFISKKVRNRRYPAETMTDAVYANDQALLPNASAQAEFLLHSLEQATGDIGLFENADKTEYICFKQTGIISTLSGKPLK